MKILYRIYQVCIYLPVALVLTIITALVTLIGSAVGFPHCFGYYPMKLWSRLLIRLLFLPVTVTGRENTQRKTSYIFVANHQGAFDIFLIAGFLGHNYRWMMKESLRRIPFVGWACAAAGHVFVNRGSAQGAQSSIDEARRLLSAGKSLVVFPEGTRTATGKMGRFKRGAFLLAHQLQLPVVPVTVEGSFQVLPKSGGFVKYHPLRLTIHKPIAPQGKGDEDMKFLMEESCRVIKSALPGEQGE